MSSVRFLEKVLNESSTLFFNVLAAWQRNVEFLNHHDSWWSYKEDNLFDYPFNGLQPRFGVCRTIRQNGASTMRPGEVHDEDDVGVVVSRRISAAFFHVIKGVVVIQSSLWCSIKTAAGCWFVNNLVKCRIEQRLLLCTYGVVTALVVSSLLVQADGDEDEQRLLWRSRRRYAQLQRRFCISQSSFGSMPELLLMLVLLLPLLLL